MARVLFLLLYSALGHAFAGEPVHGVSKDLGDAMEMALKNVEQAAKAHGTCVGTYPSIKTCTEGPKGYWLCTGIHVRSSCNRKPSELDAEIAAAKGLTLETARSAVVAGTARNKK
jgi:hypothetical protein